MKKILAFGAVFAAACAFGAQNDTVLTFSTPGVDTYADGSRVLDGECYALVWTKTDSAFGGISDTGKAVSPADRVVLFAPAAKDGRCPTTVLEIGVEDAKSFEGGTFGLYLVDTRVRGADGRVTLAPLKGGVPQVVNAVGASGAAGAASGAGPAGTLAAADAVALGTVGVRSEIAAPVITAIRVEGARVTLEVKGMSEAADYFVVPGATPGAAAPALDAKAEDGAFTFEKPEGAQFFRVIGTRKF